MAGLTRQFLKTLTKTNLKNAPLVQIRYLSIKRTRRNGLSVEEEIDIVKTNWKLRCELATAYRAFEMYGMSEGICNHLTTRAPSLFKKDGVALVIPYGCYWSEVKPEELLGIDLDTGETIEGNEASEKTAFSIHLGIYRHRSDVRSIMHTHPKYTTALSVLADPTLKMISQNATRYYDNVAYDFGYEGLADQSVNDEGDRLGKTLGDKEVMLMGNHGLVTVGQTIGSAFDLHYYFEKAAESQVLAYHTGKPLSYLSDAVIQSTQETWKSWLTQQNVDKHLEGLQKMFMKRDPSFIDSTKSDYMEYVK